MYPTIDKRTTYNNEPISPLRSAVGAPVERAKPTLVPQSEYGAVPKRQPPESVQQPNADRTRLGYVGGTITALAAQDGAIDKIVSPITESMDAKMSASLSDYNKQIVSWRDQGKYWFDPNTNVKPELDQYLANMPSYTDALAEGTMFGGGMDSDAGKRAAVVGNRALKGIGAGAGAGASIVGTIAGASAIASAATSAGAAGGVLATTGAAAAAGSVVPVIGTAIGAVVGLVAGVFGGLATSRKAKKKDAQERAAATQEYLRKLEIWERKRNTARYYAQLRSNAMMVDAMSSAANADRVRAANKKLSAAERIAKTRAGIAQSVANTQQARRKQLEDTINRWGNVR